MKDFKNHIISVDCTAREALYTLEYLPENEVKALFVVDQNEVLVGSITDGDIRRGLLSGKEISFKVDSFMNKNFRSITEGENVQKRLAEFKALGICFIPILTKGQRVEKILDLNLINTILPVTAVIMAGGRGERLRPLTDNIPKPLLKVGAKPIIEHNIDRLIKFGVSEIYISVGYLAEKIEEYLGDGSSKEITIKYLKEDQPLGTIGSLTLIESTANEHLLVMNSDLLTNIDYEEFFNFYMDTESAMCIASIPYEVKVPYAVLETKDAEILSFIEKPSYTYYSNGGIYVFNKRLTDLIPAGAYYNATDLMNLMIRNNQKITHYPMVNYWLDIGKPHDLLKAQEDIKFLKL